MVAIAIVGAMPPTPARAALSIADEDGTSRGWAHVAVDTSTVGEAGPAIRRRVQERADVVLRRAGIMPGRGPKDPTIGVVIQEVTGEDPGWSYAITIARADEAPATMTSQTCPLCTETELVDAIEGQLATIAAELESDASPAPATTDPVPPPTTRTTDAAPPAETGRLKPGGKAGVALLVTGALGIIGGAVLIALPARPKRDDPTREVFTQPPGYAVLAVGGAMAITGAVLLGLDRRRAAKRRQAWLDATHGVLRF